MNSGLIFYILLTMFFCHIVDDYYLQGWLANGKQREWWQKNAPLPLYKNDYKMALIEHGFSWSYMIHLPLIVYSFCEIKDAGMAIFIGGSVVINAFIHAFVDDLKANKKKINLIIDQICHFIQIGVTFVIFYLLLATR